VKIPRLAACLGLLSIAGPPAALSAPAPPAAIQQPQRVGGDVTRPEKLSGALPLYTAADRNAGAYGNVIVEAIIDQHGDVRNVRVVRGIAKGLDEQTVTAVKTWKFKPATKGGVPAPVYYSLSINFHVDTDSARELLRRITAFPAKFPEPAKRDAAVLASVHENVTAGRNGLIDTVRWAEEYKGESRSEMLVLLGTEAYFQARRLPIADGERASLIATGLEAENAAIAGQGAGARTMAAAAAMVWKYLLINLQAESIAKPAAKRNALEASRLVLREAQATYDALTTAAIREPRR